MILAESEEDTEERRSPSQATIDNTVAIGQLTTISERTTKDIDRLVTHIEKILPVHEKLEAIEDRVKVLEREASDGVRPKTLKNFLIWVAFIMISYAGWFTVDYFSLKEKFTSHSDVQKEKEIELKSWKKKALKRDNYNKNQITYLKGRIKKG